MFVRGSARPSLASFRDLGDFRHSILAAVLAGRRIYLRPKPLILQQNVLFLFFCASLFDGEPALITILDISILSQKAQRLFKTALFDRRAQ